MKLSLFNSTYNYFSSQTGGEGLFAVLYLILVIGFALFTLGFYIYLIIKTCDVAKSHGKSGGVWLTLTLLFGFYASIALLLIIATEYNPNTPEKVYFYKKNIKLSEAHNGQPMPKTQPIKKKEEQRWVCAKCGESNIGSAMHCINCFADKPKN